jgi:hypothetical protein
MGSTRDAGVDIDSLSFGEARLFAREAVPAGVDVRQVAPNRMVHVVVPLL